MDSKVFIRIKDKETSEESLEVTIEDIIYNQASLIFWFPNDFYCYYNDFLEFSDDYEVIVRIEAQ